MNSEVLAASHAFPLGTFPAATQQGPLYSLLRKKLDPMIQTQLDEYAKSTESFIGETRDPAWLDEQEVADLWDWAGPAGNEIAREVLFGKEDEDEDEEEASDGDEMEGLWTESDQRNAEGDEKPHGTASTGVKSAPMMPLPRLLLYMQTGGEGRWNG